MCKEAIYLLPESSFNSIYGPEERSDIAKLFGEEPKWIDPAEIAQHDAELADVQVILSGWGMPRLDAELLAKLPNLEAVFYGAGSVRGFASPEFWKRRILLTSAWTANGRPVAEFTFAEIILSLKRFWPAVLAEREKRDCVRMDDVPGAYHGVRVGLISLGVIGRLVVQMLKMLEVEVLAYDPFVDGESMSALGLRKVELAEVFSECQVVSLHTPNLPETRHMIREEHFRAMPANAVFINTARGAVVDEPAMLRVLEERPDLFALLDVTDPEPPPPGSPMYTSPNIIHTPHIAGSMGYECRRMGRLVWEECRRYLNGEPPVSEVTEATFERMA